MRLRDIIDAGNAMAKEMVALMRGNDWRRHDLTETEGTIARWRKVVAKTTHRRPVVCHACDGTGFVHSSVCSWPAPREDHWRDTRPGHVIKPCPECVRCERCGRDGAGSGVAWEERP